ncbi:MAG: ImmA/IrrE family metallo-endopeptidase [Oscillospiraceae bacterium]|jgi:hypothetical protein|nr:ImmA/IrrE family metallo-endopeptidase [Oscillospiraceae bacterium]
MIDYITKKQLYAFVEKLRSQLGLFDVPVNVMNALPSNIILEFADFKTYGFSGAAFVGSKSDMIVLNKNRAPTDQNFDCAHELIHLTKHRNYGINYFECFEKAAETGNSTCKESDLLDENTCDLRILEWQANEGAAELLLPYKLVIPDFSELFKKLSSYTWTEMHDLFTVLSQKYNTGYSLTYNRIRNLAYEIHQYENGISNIQVLSANAQQKSGITVPDYAALADRLYINVNWFVPY